MSKIRSLFRRRSRPKPDTSHLGFWHRFWIDTLKPVLTAVVVALLIRQFLIQAFHIPTGSMKDTLLVGDFLFVNKFLYGASSPERLRVPLLNWSLMDGLPTFKLPAIREPRQGDIIVFEYPLNRDEDYIKRCVGTEGDLVRVDQGVLYVNDDPYEEDLDDPEADNAERLDGSHVTPHTRHDSRLRQQSRNWRFDLAVSLEGAFRYGDRSRQLSPVWMPLATSVKVIEAALARPELGLDEPRVRGHLDALKAHVAGETLLDDRVVRGHLDRIKAEASRANAPYVVPEGHLFMMGDNRDNSQDSRFWGALDVEKIKGKALFIYWSWDKEKTRPRLSKIGDLIH